MLGSKSLTDGRVAALLKELDIDYETDADGDFQVMLEIMNGRYQQLVIKSETKRLGELEIRKLYSVGYQSRKPLSQKVANLLLGINQSSTVGAWQLMESGGEYFAAYNAHLSADVDAPTLQTVLTAVAQSADSIEDYLTGQDNF